ncbi:MAG: flagellar basal body-associated FliL family protein [Aeromonas sobria]
MKKMVVAGIALLLLALAVLGFWQLGGGKERALALVTALAEPQAPVVESKPVLLLTPLSKSTLTVPRDDKSRPYYVLLELTITSYDPESPAKVQMLDPILRNVLVDMFARKNFDQLKKLDGLGELQQEVADAFGEAIQKNGFTLDINSVLFTKLVLQ